MKKLIILIFIAGFSWAVSGQDTYDYLLKGKALIDGGNVDKAIKILSDAINFQSDYRLYIERASAYLKKRDYSSAISDFQTANNIEKGSGSYGLAETFAMKGDVVTSLYHLDIHLNTSLKKEEKVIMLDPAFGLIENSSEWRLFWKKKRYSSFETGLSEIEYELSVGKIDEAGTILNELVREYQDENDLVYAKALIAFSKKNFTEAISLLSGVPESKRSEKCLRLLAKAQYGSDNFIGAAATYNALISREVVDAGLLYFRAECNRKAGEKDKAISDLNRFLDLYPENENAISLAGKTEAEAGDNIKALEYFSKNIELHPSVPSNYIDRANAFFSSSSWKYAIDDYSMALDLKPDNADVYLNKGIALINTGKTDDACHDLRQSLKLGNKKASTYISKYCIE
jgi:tetratricopeptide (TPR) repeat protein